MHLKLARVSRGSKTYQYAQLVESYRRDDGKSTQRIVANLGSLGELEIANLRLALSASRGGQAVVLADLVAGRASVEVLDNLVWLDVAVVVSILRRLGVDRILDEVLPRGGAEVPDSDVILSLVAQRCVDPDTKLAAVEWFGRTALPELLGLSQSQFNNTRLHRALCGLEVAEAALQDRLASAVVAHQGRCSLLFLDLTDTWFVGRGPGLATLGKTKEGLYRRKIGIALLCDQDGHPLRWAVVEGRRHDSGPMKDLAWSLQGVDWARGVPLVLDRAMGATAHIEELLATGRPFLTALSRIEFDAYTNRVPSEALLEVAWNGEGAARNAGAAVAQAGMSWVSDDLYVLDLGIVTRKEVVIPATRAPVNGSDKCRERLEAAVAMQAALDSGHAKNLTEAGQPYGLANDVACTSLRLLRLAPDLQHGIAAGGATSLALRSLLALTRLDDFEAQRKGFKAALAAARHSTDGRRAKKSGRLHAAPRPPSDPPTPPKLRAVVAFNPNMWVQQMETADRLLGEIRAWARQQNEAARAPGARRRPSMAKLQQAALSRLARDHVVDAFEVQISTESIDGQDVHQVSIEPRAKEWRARQRFFGFQILVARPEEARAAAGLVADYRSKDKVEKGFQTIKGVLRLRPIHHHTDEKVRAHVSLCMLALLVERVLDGALKGKVTGASALDAFGDIHLNRVKTSAGTRPVYTITRPKADHLDLLRALDLTELVDDTKVAAAIHAR